MFSHAKEITSKNYLFKIPTFYQNDLTKKLFTLLLNLITNVVFVNTIVSTPIDSNCYNVN